MTKRRTRKNRKEGKGGLMKKLMDYTDDTDLWKEFENKDTKKENNRINKYRWKMKLEDSKGGID
jgi:hypothetical protein